VKCFFHPTEAVGVCAFCGRAICADCAKNFSEAQLACSENCAEILAQNENATSLLLQKMRQNAKASAVYYFLCGGFSLAAAVAAWFLFRIPFLIFFAAGSGIVFIISGFWQNRVAKK
jgi:predicted nucleic acid-binding Zn ribbon protein